MKGKLENQDEAKNCSPRILFIQTKANLLAHDEPLNIQVCGVIRITPKPSTVVTRGQGSSEGEYA